jgi:hypothetical protein
LDVLDSTSADFYLVRQQDDNLIYPKTSSSSSSNNAPYKWSEVSAIEDDSDYVTSPAKSVSTDPSVDSIAIDIESGAGAK